MAQAKKSAEEASKTFHNIMKVSVNGKPENVVVGDFLKDVKEHISGIWVNQDYELVLAINPYNTYFFVDKTKDTVIDGEYFIVPNNEHYYPMLRLTYNEDEKVLSKDYVINEVKVFDTLIITHEGERIHLANQSPEEYNKENES